MSEQIITRKQEAQIYCIRHGHAQYIWNCFGYVQCGRCSDQIGDRLAGVFDTTDKIWVGHECDTCTKLKENLSDLDKEILKRLEASKWPYDYEIILNGLNLT